MERGGDGIGIAGWRDWQDYPVCGSSVHHEEYKPLLNGDN